MKKIILITGGAGYIGSATVLSLAKEEYKIIVIDWQKPQSDYFRQHAKIFEELQFQDTRAKNIFLCDHSDRCSCIAQKIVFIQGDFATEQLLSYIFKNFNIDAVMHFAASIEVGLSVKQPQLFYSNNLIKTINLLDYMVNFGVKKFIFSSSCAVYGIPTQGQLTEEHIKLPINPYGKTKLMVELILQDYAKAYNLSSISLRYFNASGAILDYDIGERHDPETHIIPLLLDSAYKNKEFTIFGDNYQTPDGTPIRDYLHIEDIAQAHILALNKLDSSNYPVCESFNLGSCIGYSVKQLIQSIEEITNKKLKVIVGPQREGDPAILSANTQKAQNMLKWQANNSSLDNILYSAHNYFVKNFTQ